MATAHYGYLAFLALAVFGQYALAQQVNVVPNKNILTSQDKSVLLHCASFGLQNDIYNVVTFTLNQEGSTRVVYNSSDSKQLSSDVEVVNQTTISYGNIAGGVSDVSCRINNTASLVPITIPYISSVSFSHTPEKFKLQQNFTAKCSFEVFPIYSNVVVHFSLNQTAIGQYINIPYNAPAFNTLNHMEGINVQQGNESFSILVNPSSSISEGKYRCSVVVSIPSGSSVTVNSNEWNTSHGLALIPSIVMIALAASFAFLSHS